MSNETFSYEKSLENSTKYFNGDDLAAKVFLDKYALRNKNGDILEDTPDKMHRRIAKEFARIEKTKFKNPLSENEIFDYLDRFKYIIPQGSPMFGIGNDHQIISLSNCFLLEPPLDSYSSIMKIDEQLVSISKRRGGVGIDLDNLRPNGTPTRNAAKTSTGTVTWMERYSNSIREVGQSGRRGALMLTLSIHHPDIIDFCTVKNDPTKVTGANISVKLTKEFLNALKNNEDYELRFPVNYKELNIKPQVSKLISAKKIWDIIITSAHNRAEPGLLMWDNVTENTPADCYDTYKSKGTNPCCFAKSKNLYVKTLNGIKEIKSITNNDFIYVTDAFSEKYVKTSGYFDSGVADVYNVKLSNGQNLFITLNHKLAVPSKEIGVHFNLVPLALLNVGDHVILEDYSRSSILSIDYHSFEEVGCINVPDAGFFVTDFNGNGVISGNSEINLSPLDSCRLLCINLFSYVENPFTKDAEFNFKKFSEHAYISQRLMDNLVDLESEKIKKIINKIESDPEPQKIKSDEIDLWKKVLKNNDEGRRTGTGITALGDTLAALNIKYGSPESIKITGKIYKTLKLACYSCSVDMAEEIGAFNDYDTNKEKNNPFIKRIASEDPDLYKKMTKFGRRNISITTTAPTGSVSCLTQTTSGIEPLFMPFYTRRKKINPNDKNARTDFIDQNGDHWQEFNVYHNKIKLWMDLTSNTNWEKSPWYKCCADDIDWINRVKMQAEAQLHVCHSISSTINLPENVSKDVIADIYQTAFESGCKGITVYRKNCRTGVLVDKKDQDQQNKIKHTVAPKRPESLLCDVHHITLENKRYYVVVGLLNGDPYEVFVSPNTDDEKDPIIPKSIKNGLLIKKAKRKYVLQNSEKEFSCVITNGHSDDNADTVGRLTSASLRHGCPIAFIVHQLEKTHGDLMSFSKVLCRVLKKYIVDGTKVSGEKCPECSSELIRENGCISCKSCGFQKCT